MKIIRWILGINVLIIAFVLIISGLFIIGIFILLIGYFILPFSFFSKNNIINESNNDILDIQSNFENEQKKIDKEFNKRKIDYLNKKENFKNKELGVFYKFNILEKFVVDYQVKYYEKDFYFYRYLINDGDWINKGEPLCLVKTVNSKNFDPILSYKSGYVEHTLKENDKLVEGQFMAKIHLENEYPKQNSPQNFCYKKYNYNDYSLYGTKWYVNDGDYVKIDEKIFIKNNGKINKAKKSGFIDINISFEGNYGELIYAICENDFERQKKFINIPLIYYDDFSNSKIIKWKNVGTDLKENFCIYSKSDDDTVMMGFSFNYFNSQDHIVFFFNPKEITIKQNDEILFLFEDKTKVSFIINEKPLYLNNNNSKLLEIKSIITKNELEIFKNKFFKKWKIELINENRSILGGEKGLKPYYTNKNNLKIVINKLAKEYVEIVKKEVKNYQPIDIRLENKNNNSIDTECYVYLMKDTVNNFHKIGISNKPEYREKTLQSEKPSIELIIAKKFPVRKIAESFEKALHESYKEKRIRGEWFNLDNKDIENIIKSLK